MDGLSRKETSFHTVRVQRTEAEARKTDWIQLQQSPEPFFPPGSSPHNPLSSHSANSAMDTTSSQTKERMIGAYVVSNKMILRNWADARYAVIVLPSGTDSWRDKDMRVLADQLAFQTHAVVIVPDLYRGQTYSSDTDSFTSGSAGDIENALNMRRGQTFLTPTEWRQKQDPKRIFDDVVATIAYVRAQHNVQSVGFLGVGEGAGAALEAACDLSDLARLGMYNAIEDKLLHCGAIPPLAKNSEETPFAAVNAAITAGLEGKNDPAFDILQSVVKANLHTFTRRPQSLRMSDRVQAEHEKHERTSLQRELDLSQQEFDLEAALEAAAQQMNEENTENNHDDDNNLQRHTSATTTTAGPNIAYSDRFQQELNETETFKKLDELYDLVTPKAASGHAVKGVSLESLAGKPPSEEEVEAVMRRVQLSQLIQSAQGAPPSATPSGSVTEDKIASVPGANNKSEKSPTEGEKAAPKTADDAAIQAIEDATTLLDDEDPYAEQITTDPAHVAARAGLRKELDLELLHSEWAQILLAAQRAEKRKILAPFASHSAEECAHFVPRSVVAVSPHGYVLHSFPIHP